MTNRIKILARAVIEINPYFTVSLDGLASGTSPPSCEVHHKFF